MFFPGDWWPLCKEVLLRDLFGANSLDPNDISIILADTGLVSDVEDLELTWEKSLLGNTSGKDRRDGIGPLRTNPGCGDA